MEFLKKTFNESNLSEIGKYIGKRPMIEPIP